MSDNDARQSTDAEMTKIRDLITDIEVAMLTTLGTDGFFRNRPMGTVLDEDDRLIWLMLAGNASTADEVRKDPRVALSFADPERDRYVSISGTGAIVQGDRARIRRLWRDEFGKWFPGGPDDPALALLQVRIEQAEYWDDSAKLMRTFFDTIGAPFSGVPPEAVGEHVRLKPR